MDFFKVAWRDISNIFKNKFIRASVAAIIVVPLLYSLLYLSAFWDPYSRLSKLPVAVVNLDKGGLKDGAAVNMGKDLADKLKKDHQLGWKITSKSEAERGLKGKKYYAEFIIPEDFTQNTLSAKNGTPKQPQIIYHANMKKNFLASQINNKVKGELQAEITKNITYEYTKGAFDNLLQLKSGLNQASEGSRQLKEGISSLFGYMPELKTKSSTLSQGVTSLDTGISNAKNGSITLNNGLGQINAQIPTLVNGISSAYTASGDLSSGLSSLTSASKQISDGVSTLLKNVNTSQSVLQEAVNTNLAAFLNSNPTAMQDKNMQAFLTKLTAISSAAENPKTVSQSAALVKGSQNLYEGISLAQDGAIQLNYGLSQLNSNAPALSENMGKLYTGSTNLAEGLTTLNAGSSQLKTGVSSLTGNLPQLATGASLLETGSTQLYNELQAGSNKINSSLVNDSSTMGNFVSNSVEIKDKPLNEVKNYGTGFAPYFISLSLYVGAMLMFFVITAEVDDDIKASSSSLVIGKFFSYGYIGVLQAILAGFVVLLLGLKPQNLILYFLFLIFMSYVFISIIQCFIFLLGDAGRMLAIVLLILQLTASGGTFPNELVPKFFKVINPFMPFTYTISALREIISGITYSVLNTDVLVLLLMLIFFLTVSVLFKNNADRMQKIIEEKKHK